MSIASFPAGAGGRAGRRHLVHPRRSRLLAWLDGGEPGLDQHLATCARCADVLAESSSDVPALTEALRAVLAPPADLQSILRTRMAQRMQAKDDLGLLASLLGVSLEALRAMTGDDV